MFQVFDEMNRNDEVNKTATIGLCPGMLQADKTKEGGRITMGVPPDTFMKIISGELKPVLLVIDMKEYERVKFLNSEPGVKECDATGAK